MNNSPVLDRASLESQFSISLLGGDLVAVAAIHSAVQLPNFSDAFTRLHKNCKRIVKCHRLECDSK